jgi:hypothetical protein
MKKLIIHLFFYICNVAASCNVYNPEWIYTIDGVEYVDSSLRNDTLKVVLQ